MATESPIRILGATDRWTALKQSTRYKPSSTKMAIEELGPLGLFLRDQQFQNHEKDAMPSRCESAPPSMQGSLAAMENLFPHRRKYHVTDVTLDQRNVLPSHEEESEDDHPFEQIASIFMGKTATLGYHNRSMNSIQEDSYHASSSVFRDQYWSMKNKPVGKAVTSDTNTCALHDISDRISTADESIPYEGDSRQALSFDGPTGTIASSTVHERDVNSVQFGAQDNLSSTGVSDIDGATSEAIKNIKVADSNLDSQDINWKHQLIAQNEVVTHQAARQESITSQVYGTYPQIIYPTASHAYAGLNHIHNGSSSVSTSDVQPILHSSGFTPPLFAGQAVFMTSPSQFYPNLHPTGFVSPRYNTSGYNFNPTVLPSYLAGYPREGAVPRAFDGASFPTPRGSMNLYDLQNLQKYYGPTGVPTQHPFYRPYLQPPLQDPYGAYGRFAPQTPNGTFVNQVNSRVPKMGAELVGSSNDHRQHAGGAGYSNVNLKTGNASNHYFPTAGALVQFPSASSVSPVAQAKPAATTNFPGGTYNIGVSPSTSGNYSKTTRQSQSWTNVKVYSLLEVLKSSKGQRFELSDISGKIIEFSVDQHGSRFIQQKLETCSIEEKTSVFKEVIPHVSKLITDVFGNYVIQKLFEYGSPEQRKYLASQLEGLILSLSLQMYGCRVIQKALDVIDLEQKTKLVRELDGHVLKCVRDQNGNHVIQKCIESIPVDNIDFIISSFREHVPTLSMHPYGCRVIQRILEHCNDEIHTQFIVEEILDSVYSLAQDQYGNYVTQHVLAKGKPRERSVVVNKLAGSIVQLSQHKFASNVVEKCLEYGDSTTREVLIREILGHGDNNEILLAMMKDQYANYVIQKIVNICSDDQREMLFGLVRNHLSALKKYTYGKHIVARFEQIYGDDFQTPGL